MTFTLLNYGDASPTLTLTYLRTWKATLSLTSNQRIIYIEKDNTAKFSTFHIPVPRHRSELDLDQGRISQ